LTAVCLKIRKIAVLTTNHNKKEGFVMNHSEIWGAIEAFATAHKMSCSGLAKVGGLDPTAFNRSKRWSKYGQERWPSVQSIAKILAATGEDFHEFAKYVKKSD